MKNRKGKVDGFWLFLIGVCAVLPAIKSFTGDHDESDRTNSSPKVVNFKGDVLEIKGNSTVAPINTDIQIPIQKEVVIVKKTSPDRGDPEKIVVKGKYAFTSFDQTGSWNIDMYNADNILVDWVKVPVY